VTLAGHLADHAVEATVDAHGFTGFTGFSALLFNLLLLFSLHILGLVIC